MMQWDGDVTTLYKDARKFIRKESNSTYNRLHSISEDAEFVTRIRHFYPDFEIYPNLRCGAWYVDPAISTDRNPVYFKSTDGHFDQWAFNLRRLNLHLIRSIIHSGGVIIVDSTRQGKRLPDALSKTIPIWCAVINLATQIRLNERRLSESIPSGWGLYTPTGSVTKSEHSQIVSRLKYWAQLLLDSEFTLPSITKPLRPIWITPEVEALPLLDSTEYYSVICVSASKCVPEGLDRRAAGYTYVQGSGDDHETWSVGLTPGVFWKHKEKLLTCLPEELLDQIQAFVSAENDDNHCGEMIFPIKRTQSRMLVGMIPPTYSLTPRINHVLITCLPNAVSLNPDRLLHLQFTSNKKGQMHFLTKTLPQSLLYIKTSLDCNQNVVILCQDGKDLSAGVALAALSLFFDVNGTFVSPNSTEQPTKSTIQKRLQWILADNPYANPARNTLKRVNEYLMSHPRRLNTAGTAIK